MISHFFPTELESKCELVKIYNTLCSKLIRYFNVVKNTNSKRYEYLYDDNTDLYSIVESLNVPEKYNDIVNEVISISKDDIYSDNNYKVNAFMSQLYGFACRQYVMDVGIENIEWFGFDDNYIGYIFIGNTDSQRYELFYENTLSYVTKEYNKLDKESENYKNFIKNYEVYYMTDSVNKTYNFNKLVNIDLDNDPPFLEYKNCSFSTLEMIFAKNHAVMLKNLMKDNDNLYNLFIYLIDNNISFKEPIFSTILDNEHININLLNDSEFMNTIINYDNLSIKEYGGKKLDELKMYLLDTFISLYLDDFKRSEVIDIIKLNNQLENVNFSPKYKLLEVCDNLKDNYDRIAYKAKLLKHIKKQ